ncbi:MAG: zinc ribbon domain-containing protein [Acidobacteriota bacterium]
MEIDFDSLIQLQEIDKEIKEISIFLNSIPAKTQEIDKKIEESSRIVAEAKDKLAENQKKRRDLENQVKDLKEKIAKYKHQLNEVKTNKEYRSLLKEIDDAQSRIDTLEEEIISELLNADDIEKEIEETSQKAEEIEKVFSQEKENLFKNKAESEKNREELVKEKEKVLPRIPQDELALYQQISRKKNGIALSPVNDEFCSMCHMRIRPQVINELKARKVIILCENCGRILYWDENSG